MQQDNETDWDFIWRLAERVGFEFVVEDKIAHFRKPEPEGAVELEWPETLRSFRPRLTAVQQVEKVTLLAHDPKTNQAIDVTVSSPNQIAQIGIDRASVAAAFDGASVHVASEPVKSRAEGEALAQALLDKLANGYIAAEGIAPGNPKIRAGAKVKVSGVGTKFSGTYRVATSTHVLRGGGGYETHFANSPSHTILGAVGGRRQRSAELRRAARARDRHQQRRPRRHGARARAATPRSAATSKARGRRSSPPARATSAAC